MAVKVVVLGGSAIATPELAGTIVDTSGRTQPIELVLVSRSSAKLSRVAGVAQLYARGDSLLAVSHTTDLDAALQGADYILNQVRVGGLEARAFDESFPIELGIPGEETVGAGGFANASRTIPVVLEYARQIEKTCPTAALLTFANPSSLVQYAIHRYTSLKAIGMCDAPVSLVERIAQALALPESELKVDYLGLHHFGWVTGIWHQGKDYLPQALSKAAEIAPEVDPSIPKAFGAIPGSYFNYFFHADRMLEKKRGKRTRAEELLEMQEDILDDFDRSLAAGKKPASLARRKAVWYQGIIAPVLLALIESKAGNPAYQMPTRFILNVQNEQAIPWLPPEAIVELPTLIEGGRVLPLTTSLPPLGVKALIQRNCAYEMLATEAIVERDRSKALRALLLNPLIHTYDQAVAVLEHAWSWKE